MNKNRGNNYRFGNHRPCIGVIRIILHVSYSGCWHFSWPGHIKSDNICKVNWDEVWGSRRGEGAVGHPRLLLTPENWGRSGLSLPGAHRACSRDAVLQGPSKVSGMRKYFSPSGPVPNPRKQAAHRAINRRKWLPIWPCPGPDLLAPSSFHWNRCALWFQFCISLLFFSQEGRAPGQYHLKIVIVFVWHPKGLVIFLEGFCTWLLPFWMIPDGMCTRPRWPTSPPNLLIHPHSQSTKFSLFLWLT